MRGAFRCCSRSDSRVVAPASARWPKGWRWHDAVRAAGSLRLAGVTCFEGFVQGATKAERDGEVRALMRLRARDSGGTGVPDRGRMAARRSCSARGQPVPGHRGRGPGRTPGDPSAGARGPAQRCHRDPRSRGHGPRLPVRLREGGEWPPAPPGTGAVGAGHLDARTRACHRGCRQARPAPRRGAAARPRHPERIRQPASAGP